MPFVSMPGVLGTVPSASGGFALAVFLAMLFLLVATRAGCSTAKFPSNPPRLDCAVDFESLSTSFPSFLKGVIIEKIE